MKSKFYEKIKELYEAGRIADMGNFVEAGIITADEYEEITGEPYEPTASVSDYENALNELGV